MKKKIKQFFNNFSRHFFKKRKIEIIPAVNAESFEEVEKAISLVESYVSWVHLDVADGTFTKNTLWHNFLDLINLETNLKLEIHLMILNPEERINDWITKKVERIIFNLESSKSPEVIIKKCRENNIEVGISIGPNTSWTKLYPYLDKIDLVQVLSVYPGLSGQKFMFSSLEKINALNNNPRGYKIEVDGGVDNAVAKMAKDAGADIIVSSSYIFSGDAEKRINKLRNV